ncbi:hypothetical protein WOLCODRAFT_145017 [Wolfiporia cocos MD-104 SS10]|uniref:Uncharacterized protein n=1 Tax=Wolfiporia cocos (strain MD-104) TaxID=742152 RepID=A0A2H3K611_WOLCO|nr:hypothetical protein WOLCODRAFT_145017 [Wolfiporia cocos MD-104 SS10]
MALARAEAARRDLHSRLEELRATLTQRPSRSAAALGLWEPAAQSDNDNGVNFCTDPTAGLLHMHSLHSSPLALESRIAQIRTTMLPAYPPVPDPFSYISPSLAPNSSVPPPVRTYTSRLPQRAQSAQTRGGTPRGGRGWATRSRLDPVTSNAPQNAARVAQTVTRLVPAAEITCTTVESQTHSARDVIDADVDEASPLLLNCEVAKAPMMGSYIQIVQSVTENSPPVVGGAPTTDCRGGTAGTLLSTLVKRSAPQWWLDMEQQECYNHIAPTRNRKEGSHERRYVSGAPEQPDQHRLVTEMACGASPPVLGRADEMDEPNEGDSSLTLRDVLLKAGKEDVTRLELLGDEEMEDMVDWD